MDIMRIFELPLEKTRYRVMCNHRAYKVQTRGLLWGWNDMKETVSTMAGSLTQTAYFERLEDALVFMKPDDQRVPEWYVVREW